MSHLALTSVSPDPALHSAMSLTVPTQTGTWQFEAGAPLGNRIMPKPRPRRQRTPPAAPSQRVRAHRAQILPFLPPPSRQPSLPPSRQPSLPPPEGPTDFVSDTEIPGAPWREPTPWTNPFFAPENVNGSTFQALPENDAEDSFVPRMRKSRSQYDAMETHGSFGLIDTHQSTGGYRALVAHIPKSSRAYSFDMRVGDTIHCNAVVQGAAVGGRLTVGFVTPHKYYRPGARVTECLVGVPEDEWSVFEHRR